MSDADTAYPGGDLVPPVGPVGTGDGDVDVRLLDSPPSIAAAMARGVATGFGRPGARGELPAQRLMVADVEQDVTRLADFCQVTGGVLSDRVPATWVHVLTFPLQVALMAGRDFPFPMLGMVHVANQMRVHRPIRVRERLTLSSWAQDLRPHPKGHTVDLVGEARVGDEVVWDGRSTYLVRAQTPPASTPPAASTPPSVADGSAGDDRASQMVAGGPQLALWRLPADLGRSYARVAGDANPIHLSALSAKALGFPRAIAHGMWTHARVLAAMDARLPQAYEVRATFLKPVLLPSSVVLRGGMQSGSGDLAVTSRDGSRQHLSMQVNALS